jgi:malate synthase
MGCFQYYNLRSEVQVAAADLLSTKVPGQITLEGIKENVATCLAYTAAWVGGNGCIPFNYLMEDAATAEITRIQLWQWVKYGLRVDDTGDVITAEYIDDHIEKIVPTIKDIVKGVDEGDVKIAKEYLKSQIRRTWPSEFLTSDLMGHLAVKDGVAARFQKSVL